MSDGDDRKLWRAKDVVFSTPRIPATEEDTQKAASFFNKFKPDISNDKATAISSE